MIYVYFNNDKKLKEITNLSEYQLCNLFSKQWIKLQLKRKNLVFSEKEQKKKLKKLLNKILSIIVN